MYDLNEGLKGMNEFFQEGNAAILFKNGVYVSILHHLKDEEIDKLSEEKSFIVSSYNERWGMKNFPLYGGRVNILLEKYKTDYLDPQMSLFVDELKICGGYIRNQYSWEREPGIKLRSQIVAYLNQIEQLGVDTFLANYKAAIIAEKEELSAMCDKLAAELQLRENEEKEKTLSRLRRKIEDLIGLLFLLTINMNAGLDNQTYIDAYAESENVICQYIENAE